ncbi:MAG: dihydrodipicolinate synthase family protein [Conexibacter sp.]
MAAIEDLHGIVPPIPTPIDAEESIDLASVRRLVGWLIDEGVHGIWVLGTTGEFASFTREQRARCVEAAVEAAAGRVPVIANVSGVSTREACGLARDAEAAGADFVALMPPFYYPLAQDEVRDHCRRVRAAVDRPMLAYNIPQNAKTQFSVETILELATEGTICGLKDSQNDLDWFRQVTIGAEQRGATLRAFLGTRYLIDTGVAFAGAAGAVPGIANVAPRACVESYEAARRGDLAAGKAAAARLIAVYRLGSLARGGSATAADLATRKTALKLAGLLDSGAVTAPLRSLTPAEEEDVAAFLRDTELAPLLAAPVLSEGTRS